MKDLFIKRFEYYKMLGDKSFAQLSDEQIFWQFNEESNSIAVIVKHVAGNMSGKGTYLNEICTVVQFSECGKILYLSDYFKDTKAFN